MQITRGGEEIIMPKLQKLNHVTYLTANLAATIEFYTEVLGLKLVAAERRKLKPADLAVPAGSSLGIEDESALQEQITVMFEMLDASRICFTEVRGLNNWPDNPLPRWIKHLAMKVNSLEDLQTAKTALEAKEVAVLGPVDHGLFHSIYFFDQINNVRLEYAYNVTELTEEDSRLAWDALEVWKAGGVPANKSIH